MSHYPGHVGAVRVERLALSVCMCVYKKTRLVLYCLTARVDCHEIALNSLVVEYLLFERCLRSRESLLSRAMVMYPISNIAN